MNLQQVELCITVISIPGKMLQMVAFTSVFYVTIFSFEKAISNVSKWKAISCFSNSLKNIQRL